MAARTCACSQLCDTPKSLHGSSESPNTPKMSNNTHLLTDDTTGDPKYDHRTCEKHWNQNNTCIANYSNCSSLPPYLDHPTNNLPPNPLHARCQHGTNTWILVRHDLTFATDHGVHTEANVHLLGVFQQQNRGTYFQS